MGSLQDLTVDHPTVDRQARSLLSSSAVRPWQRPSAGATLDTVEKTRTRDGRPKRLLFAADCSAASRAALLAVAGLAVGGGTQVIVLHVDDRDQSKERGLAEDIACGLIALAADARPEWRHAKPGEVAVAIAAAAVEHGVDLVVLGSRGRSDLGGLLLGTTADQVLQRVSCPVLLVRAGRRAGARRRRVLVAVAGDENLGDMVRTAAAVAEPDAGVLVLHLLTPGDADGQVEMQEQMVHQMVTGLRRCGVRARGRVHTSADRTGVEVARTAAAYGADLIVMGSRRLPVLAALLRTGASHQASGQEPNGMPW
jgi:nucleotide-binding universal stress UspA family protein